MSQCAGGEWRDQMNHEVQREVLLHDNIELALCITYDDPEKQVRDIDSLINIPVDVLIISPENPTDLAPAVERAYDAGIPVILVDRDVKTDKYTAFIGGDNKEVGRLAGLYVASLYEEQVRLNNGKKPTVVEVEGAPELSPVKDRHTGFMQVMNRKGIDFSSSICLWHQHLAAQVVDSIVNNNHLPAIIYAHNDNMAIGIVDKLSELDKLGMIDIVSVDGAPQYGMKLVIDGNIKATIKYPTGGSEAIRTAIDILEGKRFERTQYIKPIVIDMNNAYSLREQENRASQLTSDILNLGERLTDYSKRSNWQLTTLFIFVIFTIVLSITLFLVIHKHRANKELQHEVFESMASPLPVQDEERDSDPLNSHVTAGSPAFITSLRDIISQNLENPNFSVDDMGEQLGMGRTQFFRKTKQITGYTPNDLLRTMRLQQAAQLLRSTELNISDVSRRVGFNNPSYFTRAFREQYNKSPKEYRENPV